MTTPETPQVPQQTAPVSPPYAPAAPKRRRWPWIAGAAAVILAIAGGVTYAALPSTDDEAVEFCQEEIRDRLKTPASAKFSDATVDPEEGSTVYRVSGAVDAQNGFGAMVRGNYRCTLRHNEDGSWVAITASVDQR